MNMTETIINSEFDIFEDPKKVMMRNKEYQDLFKLYKNYQFRNPIEGEVVSAKFKMVNSENFIFTVDGFKDDIYIDNRTSESKYLKNIKEGDIIDILIVDINNTNFLIKGSICSLYETRAHETIKSLEEGESIDAYIKSINPAGYDIDISHGGVVLQGFMPNTLAGINKLYNPESIVGQTLEVMIESYSESEGTYIVSRRKYLQTLIPDEVSKLEYDKVYTGHVTGTTPFGVFIEFNNCLTGMIHKANLSEDWQDRISEIQPGFEVDFYIKEVLRERGKFKIILTQILRETLWDTIKKDQILQGTVKGIKAFGVLISLDEETIGLIHSSELEKTKKNFHKGDNIKVKVLVVDRASRKIFLTAE